MKLPSSFPKLHVHQQYRNYSNSLDFLYKFWNLIVNFSKQPAGIVWDWVEFTDQFEAIGILMVLHLLTHEHCIALNLVWSSLTSHHECGFQYTNLAHILLGVFIYNILLYMIQFKFFKISHCLLLLYRNTTDFFVY